MIYLDLIFLLNFAYDFLLLLTTGITLKRIIYVRRLILASTLGASSIFLLFLKLNNIELLIIKVLVSIIMLIIAYSYNNIKYFINNVIYLYMCSIILAGFLYYLSIEFSYKQDGLFYYFDNYNINYILLLILAPIILLLYYIHLKKIKILLNLNHKVNIVFKNNTALRVNGYIDSGNKLKDPITNKYIIIVDTDVYNNKDPIYVPFKGVNKNGLLKCFPLKYIEINGKQYNNYLLGVSDDKIILDGSNCILNYKLLEDLNV